MVFGVMTSPIATSKNNQIHELTGEKLKPLASIRIIENKAEINDYKPSVARF